MDANGRRDLLNGAVKACVLGKVDALPDAFTADVNGWSPNMHVSSLAELTEVVAHREDSLSDVAIEVNGLDVVGNKGFMEYRVSAVFSGPFMVDEDTSIEANGRRLLIGAALVAEFEGDKISAFRNYFDDASLLEQMLVA
jgi:SnoaL-like polyketide cyclase